MDPTTTYDSWGSDNDRFQDGSLCIGIDLGTTNSCVGMWHVERHHVKILKSREHRGRTTPSVVHFDPQSSRVSVGEAAIAQEFSPPGNTIRTIKRLMGQKFPSHAVEIARSYATHTIVATAQGLAGVQVQRDGQDAAIIQPEEVDAPILQELKAAAESYWDGAQRIDNVVITVPAYFSDAQRKATLRSAQLAGFKAVRLLNEPTAAAMAYGLFVAGRKTVVVVDFGGGTLDVSLLAIDEGKFEVLGIGGDTSLGGEDVTHALVAHVLELLAQQRKITCSMLTRSDLITVKRAVEAAKIELSSSDKAVVGLDDVLDEVQRAACLRAVYGPCSTVNPLSNPRERLRYLTLLIYINLISLVFLVDIEL